jgi:hypothetical protein
MKSKAILLGVFSGVIAMAFFVRLALRTSTPAISGKVVALNNYGRLPLSFEANHGQADEQVQFISRGRNYSLFLTSSEAVLALRKSAPRHDQPATNLASATIESESPATIEQAVLRMQLVDANAKPRAHGLEELPGKMNFFAGNDPAKWRTNVATYAKVKYETVYPDIDLVYYGNQQKLEYDFIVAPGADPAAIKLEFSGADKLAVDASGDLVAHVGDEQVRMHKPIIYQEREGARQEISGGYKLLAHATHENVLPHVGFEIENYDRNNTLVIDPVLAFSTFIGGSDDDIASDIAVDASGNIYISGNTASANFPTVNPVQPAPIGNLDLFIMKLNASGTAIVYATCLGGTSTEFSSGIAVDVNGNAHISGQTFSTNFPTVNAIQTTFGGSDRDAVVAKLNASGNALLYSTYLGGVNRDRATDITVDASGNAYLIGVTASPNFPLVNAFQSTLGAGSDDAFITKLNSTGSAIIYSTFLGGSNVESGNAIEVDASGNAYLTGLTASADFPLASPLQSVQAGDWDVFVTKLNATGSALVYSTFLGGSGQESGFDLTIDASGNAYVTGHTNSSSFPLVNPLQSTFMGVRDIFVTKVNASGSALVYSTLLGGAGEEFGNVIAVNASGYAHVGGQTLSTDFPTVNALQPSSGGGQDAFILKLNPSGSALMYSTYLGGSLNESCGVTLDAKGNLYVRGLTFSADFPTFNALQPTYGGGMRDAFVAKIVDQRLFAFLANKVTLKSTKQATPTGDIHSNGTLTVEKGDPSVYNSNLSAVGKITIQKENTINGNVTSPLAISNAGTINGVTTVEPVANIPLPSKSFSAGGLNRTVPNGGVLALAPGSYNIVTLNNGGTLKLTSGDYFFTELRYPGSEAVIEFDLSSGAPANVHIVSNFQFGKEAAIRLLPNGESDSELVTFFTLQSTAVSLGKEAYFLGTLNAPNALVTLVKNSQLRGSICAKEILVEKDCLFLHHDSPGTLPGPGNLPKLFVEEEEASEQLSVISYQLEQNYPNPFNPSTTISFSLPEEGEVSLAIYNMSGQLVKRLVAGEMNAGRHSLTWDATDASGARVASGVYLCVIKAGKFTAQRKLVLMK